jgi:crotonobetainyl-CoA:carnitine CoA-transferase CaiB-like acyl-CoA transferase
MKLKVLDFSRVLAGPYCSMMLGDLGADVIKVERPHGGDETRGWGPPFDTAGESAYFLSANRNKKSIAADLTDLADQAFVRKLISEADVVLDNFLEGALQRLGLDPVELLTKNPRLIWCTISGFERDSMRPGYDFVVQAECGWMSITGEKDGAPMKAGVALADVIAGKDAAIAILAAIAERSVQPLALARRRIRITLAESARAALTNVAQNVLVTGQEAERWGNAHPNLVPYELFEARDRPLVIAVGSDAQWKACARALSLIELEEDETLATNAGRVRDRVRVVAAISKRVRENAAPFWVERLQQAGVPCGLVKTVQEALASSGASPVTGVTSSVGGNVRLRPPRLDEHGDSIRALRWGAFQ